MSKFETRCIHGQAHAYQDPLKSVSFPLYQTATFGHIALGKSAGFDYTRESNPTRQQLEETIASLEGAAATIAFSSGMAAISACMDLFESGSHIICSEDLYGGVTRYFNTVGRKNGLTASYVDTTDLSEVEAAIRPETKALYIETPTNPMMGVTDLRKASALAKEHKLKLIVDNTFLSPYFQQPLSLGADIVLHSGSKFLSGHNDTIAGFLCTNSPVTANVGRLIAKTTGALLDPFDCWMTLRGLKTLAVRMEQQQKNALAVAQWLEKQPKIKKVYYVGLENHPGYETNRSQASGFGSMISFHTDTEETAKQILEGVKLITFAESLGGTESLITYPMVQTHSDVSKKLREKLGITETLLRLSVGLEHVDDLIDDLKQAMEG